jgi:hypothetical protein
MQCVFCCVLRVQVSADLWKGMQGSAANGGVAAAGATASAAAVDGARSTRLVPLCGTTSTYQ